MKCNYCGKESKDFPSCSATCAWNYITWKERNKPFYCPKCEKKGLSVYEALWHKCKKVSP